MRQFLSTAFLLFIIVGLHAQKTKTITIQVSVPKASDEVFIVGNQQSLGNWNPSEVKMKKTSDYERSITVEVSLPVEFKFTRGDWNTEGVIKLLSDNPNLIIDSDKKTSYNYTIKGWSDKMDKDAMVTSYKIIRLNSEFLNEERIIKVYVPEDYDASKKYPVFYVTDAHFHPNFEIATQYLKQLNNFEIVPQCIVVGINQKRRNNELTVFWNKSGEAFQKFIFDEVVPFINKSYSTSGFNTIIGHSNGATYNHLLMTKEGNPFRGFINLSEYYADNQLQETADYLKKYQQEKSLFFFVASATYDSENRTESGEKIDSLFRKNTNKKIHLKHKVYDAGHNDLVAKSLLDGMQFIFSQFAHLNGFDEDNVLLNSDLHPVKIWNHHKAKIKSSYGLELVANTDDLDFLQYKAIKAKNINQYEEVCKLFPELFNENQLEYYSFKAQGYESMGYYEEALELWKTNLYKDKATQNSFYYRRPYKILYEDLKRPKEAIELMEYGIKKYPKGTFIFNYYILKSVVESNIEKKKGKKALKYLQEKYRKNRYFSKETLDDYAKKLSNM